MCFHSWERCSLLHRLTHCISLLLSAGGVSPPLLCVRFLSAKSPCFSLRALCCNSRKCPGYQYFISKYISCTVSSSPGASRWNRTSARSAEQTSTADKADNFILFKLIEKMLAVRPYLLQSSCFIQRTKKFRDASSNVFLLTEIHAWLQRLRTAQRFAWCCPCNVLHGCLQCAAFAFLRSCTHACCTTRMYAACTNVICWLCGMHPSVQRTNRKSLTQPLFLQACGPAI